MSDYGYVNARIRAMKSYLMKASDYNRLLSVKDLTTLIAAFNSTRYADEIRGVTAGRYKASAIEQGLSDNLVATFKKIISFLEPRQLRLVSIFLGRWDLQNIKTILRGKHVGVDSQEILDNLILLGELEESTLTELAKQEDIKSCIDLLATWRIKYAKPLTQAFPKYHNTGQLAYLELALDKFFYAQTLKKLASRKLDVSLVREIVAREIDLKNIIIAFRLLREKQEVEKAETYFIDGGKDLPKEEFLALLEQKNLDEAVKLIKIKFFSGAIEQGYQTYLSSGNFSALERAMEDKVIKRAIALFRAEPLGIATIIAYLWAKTNEVVNLRIIARGKEAGMPKDRIKDSLVLV